MTPQKVLALIVGGFGSNKGQWAAFAKLLGPRFVTEFYELPKLASTVSDSTSSLDSVAASVAQRITLDRRSSIVIGHSLGTAIVERALRNLEAPGPPRVYISPLLPNVLNAAVVASYPAIVPPMVVETVHRLQAELRPMNKDLAAQLRRLPAPVTLLRAISAAAAVPNRITALLTDAETRAVWDLLVREAVVNSPRCASTDLSPGPLVVVGRLDPIQRSNSEQHYRRYFGNGAELKVLNTAGHAPHLTHPAKTAIAICDYLTSINYIRP